MTIIIKKPVLKTDKFTPEPQMDWEEIRRAKVRCENKCACFNSLSGGCSLGLLPSLTCREFKRIIRMRGSSSEVERLFANEETAGSNPVSRSKKVARYHRKRGNTKIGIEF